MHRVARGPVRAHHPFGDTGQAQLQCPVAAVRQLHLHLLDGGGRINRPDGRDFQITAQVADYAVALAVPHVVGHAAL